MKPHDHGPDGVVVSPGPLLEQPGPRQPRPQAQAHSRDVSPRSDARKHVPWLAATPDGEHGAAWGKCLEDTYLAVDAWTLVIATVNLWLTGWHSAAFIEGARAELWMRAWLALIAATGAGARALLAASPRRYARARTALAVAARVQRAGWVLAWHWLVGRGGMRAFYERRYQAGMPHARALTETLVIVGMFWVMQALWFPLPLRWSAPLQAATCAAGLWCFKPLACHVKADPALLDAARAVCRGAAAARRLAAALAAGAEPGGPAAAAAGGAGAAGGWDAVCRDAPIEALLALSSAISFILPLYVMWAARVTLEARFHDCRTTGGEKRAPGLRAPPPRAPPLCLAAHAAAAACMLLASFAVAYLAATLGRPHEC